MNCDRTTFQLSLYSLKTFHSQLQVFIFASPQKKGSHFNIGITKIIYFFPYFMCTDILPVCMSVYHVCMCLVPKKLEGGRVLDPMELKFQTVVSYHVSAGN